MPQVFVVECDALSDPVTIVARDGSEAFRIFHVWRERHAHQALHSDATVIALTERDLTAQPQLKDAASIGMTGVAWWVGHRMGWAVTAPDADVSGSIAPPSTAVNCFVFPDTADFGTIQVFAETRERAIATLHLHSLDQCGHEADYTDITEISSWHLMGDKVTLREEMFEEQTGIGVKCEDGYWHIFPADYDPPLGWRRPSES